MARPLYETRQHLTAERGLVALVEQRCRVTSQKLPLSYRVDSALFRRGVLVALAEFKCRTCTREQYEDYIVSAGKVLMARQLSEMLSVPVMLIVQWTNAVGWIDIGKTSSRQCTWGGRTDRKDSQDSELLIHLPIIEFGLLSGERRSDDHAA